MRTLTRSTFLCAIALSIVMPSDFLMADTREQKAELTGPYLGQEPPGDTPLLFAPGIVSTCKEHSAAMFTPDGAEMWFGRMFPAAIYVMKLQDEVWTGPRRATFSSEHGELYPYLSHNGSRIYFTSGRPAAGEEAGLSRGRGRIWCVTRTDQGWDEPFCLDPNINMSERQACGSVVAGGGMYFGARIKKDGGYNTEIVFSDRIDGEYLEPRVLGETINSAQPEFSPHVAQDQSYMIFSSFRGGLGLSDLFVSFRDSEGGWTRAINLGSKINSPYKDEYPYLTTDGKYLFFNSNRPSALNERAVPDGPGNIYWVDAGIIRTLRP